MPDRKEAYRLAIQSEIMSQNLYQALSRSFSRKPEISRTLAGLVPLEKQHEDKLREAFAREFPGTELSLDPGLLHQAVPADLANPEQVLEFAISRELLAAGVYHEMAAAAETPELRQLLLQLAQEEEFHKTVLETEILRLDGLVTWFDPSELNGLMED